MIRATHYHYAALACLVLYWPGLAGPYLFDSYVALVANPALAIDPLVFTDWRAAALSSSSGPLGRPLSMLSFAANYAIWGQSAFAFKLVNLLLHVLTGYLILRWLSELLQRSPVLAMSRENAERMAVLSAILWLLSPLQVSTVLYSVQRMEQLSTLFVLAGLYGFTLYRSRWVKERASLADLANCLLLVTVFTLLAAYSKEDGVLLPVLIALVEVVLFRGRYGGLPRPVLFYPVLLLCILPVVLVLLLAVAEPRFLLDFYGWRPWSPWERLLTQARVLWHAVGWFYWPDVSNMTLFHDDIEASRGWLHPASTAVSVAAWLAVLTTSLYYARREPVPAFCVLFFLFSHGLESSIVPLDLVYEHRSYMGNLALALLLVWSILRFLPGRGWQVCYGLLLLAFSASLLLRSYQWGDELRLNEAQLRNHPESARATYYYANLNMRLADEVPADEVRQRVLTARRYFEHLLELDPGSMPALASLLYIDSRWFPGLEREPWLSQLEQQSRTRVMEPSDVNALGLLVQCEAAGYCSIPQAWFVDLISALADRYPGDPAYAGFLTQYLAQREDSLAAALGVGEQAAAVNPSAAQIQLNLSALYRRSGERGKSMLVLKALLAEDPEMRHLKEVKGALQ